MTYESALIRQTLMKFRKINEYNREKQIRESRKKHFLDKAIEKLNQGKTVKFYITKVEEEEN